MFLGRLHTKMSEISSSLISFNAPMSSQDTSGIVAKPSRFADGWIRRNASFREEKFHESPQGIKSQTRNTKLTSKSSGRTERLASTSGGSVMTCPSIDRIGWFLKATETKKNHQNFTKLFPQRFSFHIQVQLFGWGISAEAGTTGGSMGSTGSAEVDTSMGDSSAWTEEFPFWRDSAAVSSRVCPRESNWTPSGNSGLREAGKGDISMHPNGAATVSSVCVFFWWACNSLQKNPFLDFIWLENANKKLLKYLRIPTSHVSDPSNRHRLPILR